MATGKIGLSRHNIDWVTILIYIALVVMGWVSIYAAVYDDEGGAIFDLTKRYGMQMMWIGASWFVALVITLSDSKYYHMFSYPLFYLMLAVMLGTLVLGREVNGAKSWLSLGGGVNLQPVEFMKLATALALARFMSSYNFDIRQVKSFYYIGLIILVPVMIILLQNDTGSALVFCGFFIMLYREGLGKELYIIVLMLVALFLLSFLVEPLALTFATLVCCFGAYALKTRDLALPVSMLGMILLIMVGLVAVDIWFDTPLTMNRMLLISVGLSLPWAGYQMVKRNNHSMWIFVGVFAGAMLFTACVDYAFENVLQLHQQKRILDLLGIENDPKGWSYNVIQSKIAIGSGGFLGKGFLEGTQTKFSFVPEQSTDFIFCTVGEEWGFVGTLVVVVLFVVLIWRLMRMGERQKEPFGRVYCYGVASILFMHFFINIAMTIGMFPVVGIPLPFFSYGGSSLMAFTILLFIAIRLDSTQPTD